MRLQHTLDAPVRADGFGGAGSGHRRVGDVEGRFGGVIPIGLFADLIDGLGDPRIAREGGETPGFVT